MGTFGVTAISALLVLDVFWIKIVKLRKLFQRDYLNKNCELVFLFDCGIVYTV